MKKIIKFIKDFLVLREEDKLYKIPWEMLKWIWEEPHAYKFKGTILIPHDQRKKWWKWERKRTVKQSK